MSSHLFVLAWSLSTLQLHQMAIAAACVLCGAIRGLGWRRGGMPPRRPLRGLRPWRPWQPDLLGRMLVRRNQAFQGGEEVRHEVFSWRSPGVRAPLSNLCLMCPRERFGLTKKIRKLSGSNTRLPHQAVGAGDAGACWRLITEFSSYRCHRVHEGTIGGVEAKLRPPLCQRLVLSLLCGVVT